MRKRLALMLALATGAAGLWLGAHPEKLPGGVRAATALLAPGEPHPAPQGAAAAGLPGATAYWRDPGKPAYSASPRKTADGRDYVAVPATADVRFSGAGTIAARTAAVEAAPAPPRRIKFYRNPMGLPDTSPVPKKDSMGMDYIAVYEGGDADDGKIITVAPGKLQSTGVRSEPAAMRAIAQTVRVPGTVQLDERRVAVVATRSDAFVDKVANVTTGDRVRKGDALLTVYSPEINAAAAQLIATPGFGGSLRRLRNLNVSEAVIAEISRSHDVPLAITWAAPRDGIILERAAVDGMRAAAGTTLFRIGDISVMWVLADVPEHAIGLVRLGQPASVRVRSRPDRVFTGRIDLIYPQVNSATRSTRVRVELPNPDGALLADMYADVAIATGTPTPVMAVPDDAVIDTGTRQTVIIDRGGGRLEPRPVTVGVRGDGFTEIRDGVRPGERVVTGANFLIDAESNLKAAFEGLAAAATDAPGTKP